MWAMRDTCSRQASLTLALVLLCIGALEASPRAAGSTAVKAKQAEAKGLTDLGRAAEKKGDLLQARQQFLDSEHVVFSADAEKGLERVAQAADARVTSLMADAAQAYAAE